MPVQIGGKYPRLSNADLGFLESELVISFPQTYREFLKTFNVGIPAPNQIETPEITASVVRFYGVSDNEIEDLLQTNDVYSGRLPENVLAIAEAAGGNLICLDLKTGEVYWWDHEEEAVEDELQSFEIMYLLASSFPEFLGRLEPRRPLRAETLKGTMPPDDDIANRNAGLESTPEGYTWHHKEDGKTMQLVPTDMHRSFQHSGGAVILRSANQRR